MCDEGSNESTWLLYDIVGIENARFDGIEPPSHVPSLFLEQAKQSKAIKVSCNPRHKTLSGHHSFRPSCFGTPIK
jgi:hypothetical protein